jgi:hypothetical protein
MLHQHIVAPERFSHLSYQNNSTKFYPLCHSKVSFAIAEQVRGKDSDESWMNLG